MVGIGQGEEISKNVKAFWNDTIGGDGSFDGVEGIYYLMSSAHSPGSAWRWVVALSPLLFGMLFAAWRATEKQKSWNGEHTFSIFGFFQSLWQGKAFSAPGGERDDFDLGGAFLKLLDWILMLALIGSWYWLAMIGEYYQPWLFSIALVLVFSGVMMAEKVAIWRARPRRRHAFLYGLRLWNRSLLSWLVLGSVLYFVLLLVSLPLRARAEIGVEKVLRLGEVGASQILAP